MAPPAGIAPQGSFVPGGANYGIAGTFTAAQTFQNQTLKINNPANTFAYIVNSSAIVANRNITLPLLGADDTFVFANFAQTLKSKLLDSSNTIVDATDTTKVFAFALSGMTTAKTLTFSSSQTTSQTLTIPNITGADTLVTLALAQTFSGVKTFGTNIVFTPIADPAASQGQVWLSSTNADVLKYSNGSTIFNVISTKGATTTSTPGDPLGTTSTTQVMMGLAGALTPVISTRVLVIISGQMSNGTVNDGATVQLRTGTGGAPSNGAAFTGTQQGASQTTTSLVASQRSGFCISAIVTGLTIGTAIWIDASLAAVTGGTANIFGVTISAHEI